MELWAPALYAVASIVWIAGSDHALQIFARTPEELARWGVLKGFAFVAVTAAALYLGLRWAGERERRAARARERARDVLRFSEERLSLAIEAAELGIWHARPYGELVCSERARAILGLAEGERVPDFDALLARIHPEDRETVRRDVTRWLDPSGDGRYHGEYRVVRPDGSVRWVTWHGNATFEEADGVRRPVKLVGALVDVTERRVAEAQLVQSDRLASVGMLAAGVAHEINNPLAYLIASLGYLEEELKDGVSASGRGELQQAIADAREGAERVKHVVRDLKTFSRAQDDRRVRVALPAVLDTAINMAANEIKYRARLVREYGSSPEVLANDARLGQVFLNLLINAAHAIPEGRAPEHEIRVVTRTDARGRAVVEVRDTGAGIAPEALGRIFDPFYTTKPVGQGTGLGLSICRNIVLALGGTIEVSSRPGAGSTFRVLLPAAPDGADEGDAAQGEVARGRRGRVLVVDDEPAIGAAIRRMIAAEHDVTVVTAAGEARDRIARGERFDVILCDLMMPHMTGMDLHAELERIAPDQAERLVVLTGGAFTSGAHAFLSRVPNDRLEKPFEPARLREVVSRLVG